MANQLKKLQKKKNESTSEEKLSYRKQRFRQEWTEKKEFRGWLSTVEDDPHRAFCIACKSKLVAGSSELLKHSKRESHKRALILLNKQPIVSNCQRGVSSQKNLSDQKAKCHITVGKTGMRSREGPQPMNVFESEPDQHGCHSSLLDDNHQNEEEETFQPHQSADIKNERSLLPMKKMKVEKDMPIIITAKPGLFIEDDYPEDSHNMQVQGLNITISEVQSVSSELILSVDEPTVKGPSYDEEEIDTKCLSGDKKRYAQKFRQYWYKIPEFQGWLAEGDSPYKAHCTVCNRDIRASISQLQRHCKGARHINFMAKHQPWTSIIISEDITTEAGLPPTVTFVDLRSDTVTRPSRAMKNAMLEAAVGDDAFSEDPTVNALEKKVANMLGKEAALFVPSGTMANLVCVLAHCWGRGSEVIVGDKSYMYQKMQGGIAQVGGVHHRIVKNLPDGTFSLDELKTFFQDGDTFFPTTTLVCIENTHNRMGGKALPLSWLDELGAVCEELNLLLHVDGARLINASVALGVPPSRLVARCHSVTLCLNKGLGAPMGSLVVGTQEFITRAGKMGKMLGGVLHQCGMVAAAGIYALDHVVSQLSADHNHARAIAHSVLEEHSSSVTVDMNAFQTNIGFLHCDNIRVDAKKLCQRLRVVTDSEEEEIGEKIIVMMLPITDTVVRFMTHHEIKMNHVRAVAEKLKYVIQEFDNIMFDQYKV
ncbi:putative low-specificity L-threonine aldolase 1 [Halocaridina rubra]|uniref:Low-specificity L-threonine aldolase 1 n=1 Tax=Halocaridina rubra TaxID=373956 RepID=A0AAN8XFG4_HALRR